MSFWRCNIERTAEDKLHQEVWSFAQFDNRLVLDLYAKLERATTRHKFQVVSGYSYSRLDRRRNQMELSAVPWPDDVIADAKQRFIDSITVEKDYIR